MIDILVVSGVLIFLGAGSLLNQGEDVDSTNNGGPGPYSPDPSTHNPPILNSTALQAFYNQNNPIRESSNPTGLDSSGLEINRVPTLDSLRTLNENPQAGRFPIESRLSFPSDNPQHRNLSRGIQRRSQSNVALNRSVRQQPSITINIINSHIENLNLNSHGNPSQGQDLGRFLPEPPNSNQGRAIDIPWLNDYQSDS
ncbi:hypothetical protein PN498_13310 [Oscillatoria sp. CS-180]|nr:hypothetical protein [Oscillatoria sp. CS-180]